jgi:hypothetical protein
MSIKEIIMCIKNLLEQLMGFFKTPKKDDYISSLSIDERAEEHLKFFDPKNKDKEWNTDHEGENWYRLNPNGYWVRMCSKRELDWYKQHNVEVRKINSDRFCILNDQFNIKTFSSNAS